MTTRRERYRAETLDEIKAHALDQLAAGGPSALSLNAIAKRMGVSGPALYRYFASRDDLVTALIVDAYGDLADALEDAHTAAARKAPEGRFAAVADAYRAFAHAHPQRYALVFSVHPPGYVEPGAIATASHRAMVVLLTALGDVAAGHDGRDDEPRTALDRQLVAWARARPGTPEVPPRVLELGVLTWTRLHGVLSLELLGIPADMGLDAEKLYAREVALITRTARTGGAA
jgi:AcrR family transcriptional regulator